MKQITTIEIETCTSHKIAFGATNSNWNPSAEYNLAFIRSNTEYLQRLLDIRGHLFVNEVLEAFGFDRTPDGQVSGWLRKDGYLVVDATPRPVGDTEFWIEFKAQGVIVNDI